MATVTSLVLFILFPLVVLVAVLLWATESRDQRIRRWVRSGLSQREAARRLGVSRYAVSKAMQGA
jgi:predicted DNA-binding protein (UPF0251 family)